MCRIPLVPASPMEFQSAQMKLPTKLRLVQLMVFGVLIFSRAGMFGADLHQTASFSPIGTANDLPYQVTVRLYDFGDASLPTLHSYAAATHADKWVVLAGRTNGIHGFDQNPYNNFPAASQNRDVWVIESGRKTKLAPLARGCGRRIDGGADQFDRDDQQSILSAG